MIEHNGVRLDWLSQEVLYVVSGRDGARSNTSELKSLTGVDSRHRIKHRFEKLVEAGLAEVSQPEPEDNQFPPKEVMLTGAGKAFVEEYDIRGGGGQQLTTREQVERMESRMGRMQEQMGSMVEQMRVMGEMFGFGGDTRMPNVAQTRAGFFAMNSYFGRNMDVEFEEEMPSAVRKEMEELTARGEELSEELDGAGDG